MRGEVGHLARDWWCRGGGAAVLALLAVVATFRRPDDLMFWAAVAFFAVHSALAVRRWLRARRIRITATVIRHHDRHDEPLASRPRPPSGSPPESREWLCSKQKALSDQQLLFDS